MKLLFDLSPADSAVLEAEPCRAAGLRPAVWAADSLGRI